MSTDTPRHERDGVLDRIPGLLEEYARRGDCVFIIGEDQRLGDLTDKLARECNYDDRQLSFPEAAQFYRWGYAETQVFVTDQEQKYSVPPGTDNRQAFNRLLKTHLRTQPCELEEFYQKLADPMAPISRIVALNYGSRLRRILGRHRRYTEIVLRDDINACRAHDDVTIVRLLGTVEDPNSLVVDMDGFDSFETEETEKTPLIDFTRKEVLAGRAVVLVHCDPTDRNLQLVLDRLLEGSSSEQQPRFALVGDDVGTEALTAWQKWEVIPIQLQPVDAAKALCELQPAPKSRAPATAQGGLRPPYKFLDYYGPEERDLFCGRDDVIENVIACIRDAPLTLVYGRSGVGKTSVIRAGVIPALDKTLSLYVRLGDDPLAAIAEEAASQMRKPMHSPHRAKITPSGVQRQLHRLAAAHNVEVAIFVDQFEECFVRLSEKRRQDFADLLHRCLDTRKRQIIFVLSLREEFLAQAEALLRDHLKDIWRSRLCRVLPLTDDNAKSALVKPAERVGLSLDPRVVDAILRDLRTPHGIDPSQLSIVIYRLYQQAIAPTNVNRENRITLEHYEELGKAQAILAGYVDGVLEKLATEDQRQVARYLLKHLVALDRDVKEFMSKQELLARSHGNTGDSDPEAVLDWLVDQRLVRSLEWQKRPYYELAHECMIERIKEWPEPERVQTARSVQEMVRRRLVYWRSQGSGVMEVSEIESALQQLGNPHLRLTGEELAYLGLRAEQYEMDASPCIEKLRDDAKQQEYGEGLLIPLALTVTQTPQELEQQGAPLGSPWDKQAPIQPMQWAALQVLGKLWGVVSIGDIVSPNVEERRSVVEKIGETHTVRAAGILLWRAQVDGDSAIRHLAAQTLVYLGPSAARQALVHLEGIDLGRPAAGGLALLIDSLRGLVATASAAPVGEDKEGEARQAILDWIVLLLQHDDGEVRSKAAQALQEIGWRPPHDATGAAYWFALGDSSECAEIGLPAISFLLKRLGDDRRQATETLAMIGSTAVDPLESCLQNENKDLRLAAIEGLERIGDERAENALANHLLREVNQSESQEEVSLATISALGRIALARAPVVVPDDGLKPPFGAGESEARRSQDRENTYNRIMSLLLANLRDGRAAIRQEAVSALRQRGWQPTEDAWGASYWFVLGKMDECIAVGEPAVDVLLERLRDSDSGTRQRALEGLGRVRGNSTVVTLVVKRLEDEAQGVRIAAVRALAQLGGPALEPLIQHLTHEDAAVRLAIVEALDASGDSRAVTLLCGRLKRERDGDVRLAVIKALGRARYPGAVGPLVRLLKEWDASIRFQTVLALQEIADPRSVQPLLDRALSDGDAGVRRVAGAALVKLGSSAIGAIADRLRGITEETQTIAIIHILGQIGGESAASLIVQQLAHDSPQVRQVAARTLGQLASASAQNGLAASLADEDSAVRQAAALAMQRIGWEPTNDVNGAAYWFSLGDISQCAEIGLPAIPFLLKRLSDRRPLATEVLIAIGQPAVDPLATYLEGADKDFRLAVMQVLEQIGGERAEAAFADYLLRCLQDKRETVRREVVTALRQRGWLPTEATQSLLDELNSEPSLDVKKQVIETLGELGPKELAQPLAAWLEDDELTIRRATAHALQQLGWVPQEDLPQAAYWYHLGKLDMCLILGESAMRILRQQLTDRHWQARTAAAQILREQLWLPSLDAAGASYWICSGEIDKCTQLGTDAVRPLFDCLAMTPERSADDDSYPNSFRLAQVLEAVWEDEAFKQTVRSLDEDDFDRVVRVMEPVSRWFGYPNPRHYRRVLLWRRQWRRLARCLMPRFIRRIFDDLVFDRLGCLLVECLLLCLVGGALLWLLYRAFADMPLSKNSIMSRWPVEPWVVLLIGWTLVSVSIVVRVLSASRPKVEDDHGSSARHDNP